jgi:ribosome-associated protein
VTDSKPSKSERKRTQTALQELGERLIDLQDEHLDSLSLDERLFDAIQNAKRMKSHEARRRQKQFIGKLMRDVDPEPINTLLAKLKADDLRLKRVFANAERWRDRLIADGQEGLQALAAETGQNVSGLAGLLADFDEAISDRMETTIRRNIFRQVHEILAACSRDR